MGEIMGSRVYKLWNEMGAGFEEAVILADPADDSVSIIHVGVMHDVDTPSSVDVTNLDERGYTNV